jgi:hypothetical protein
MVNLNLRRYIFTDKCTIGELTIQGNPFKCYVLEDTVRNEGVKIYGETAIPSGIYKVVFQQSAHFKREMPYLQNVKNYTGIMIHWGTKIKDTLGCLLVGKNLKKIDETLYEISDSRRSFDELFMILQQHRKEDIFIEIVNEFIPKDFKPNVDTVQNERPQPYV